MNTYKVTNLTKDIVIGSHYPNPSAAFRTAQGRSVNNDDVYVITCNQNADYASYVTRGEKFVP